MFDDNDVDDIGRRRRRTLSPQSETRWAELVDAGNDSTLDVDVYYPNSHYIPLLPTSFQLMSRHCVRGYFK